MRKIDYYILAFIIITILFLEKFINLPVVGMVVSPVVLVLIYLTIINSKQEWQTQHKVSQKIEFVVQKLIGVAFLIVVAVGFVWFMSLILVGFAP